MNEQIQELYLNEQEQGRLVYESFPEYDNLLRKSLPLFPDEELPKVIFDLLETSNCIAFAHGLRLGLRLRQWAEELSTSA